MTIGPGCRIEAVEYPESLHIDPQANVAHYLSSAVGLGRAGGSQPGEADGSSGSERPESLSRWRVRFGRREIHRRRLKSPAWRWR